MKLNKKPIISFRASEPFEPRNMNLELGSLIMYSNSSSMDLFLSSRI